MTSTIFLNYKDEEKDKDKDKDKDEDKVKVVEKTIYVAYFRKAEGARISNMIFSAHHQSIIQRQRQ